MTDSPDTETADEQDDRPLSAGDFAEDTEDDGTLVVVAETGVAAEDHTVAATGDTVAEHNPGLPADSEVLFCAYRNQLDSTFGEGWRNRSPTHLAFSCGDRGVPIYSFPRARLAYTEPDMAGLEGTPHEDVETEGEPDDADDATESSE